MDQPFEVEVQPVGGPRRRRPPRRLVAAGLVLAAIVVGLVVLVGTGGFGFDHPQVPVAHPNRIVFVDADGGLSTIDADGTNRRAFVVTGATFLFPAWSPDGSHIAAIGGDASEAGIYVLDDRAQAPSTAPSGGAPSPPAPVVVYGRSPQIPIYAAWSPDGRRLAFITGTQDGITLQTVLADGTGTPTILRSGQPMYWAWVDDAHLLIHSGGDAQDAFLGEVGLDASTAASVAGAMGQFQAPGISRSGSFRAYVATNASAEARVVVESRRGSTRFEAAVAGPTALGWSPTGDQLAFTAPPQPFGFPIGSLRLMDAATGATRTVLDGLVAAYFWAPDGRTIAALRVAVPGGETVAATPSASPVAPPSGGSLRLTFVDVATGTIRSDRAVRLPDLLLSQFVPFFDQYALSHRIWSPTSDAIVLPLVSAAGVSEITVVPADGSASRRIADGVTAFWSP